MIISSCCAGPISSATSTTGCCGQSRTAGTCPAAWNATCSPPGEQIVRVPPKLMAHARDSARTYGKSDPIDALAVARAALREPDLPTAQLDGPAREVRLLVDHREALVGERTRVINRLRWHLHELDPTWEPKARSLDRLSVLRHTSTARIAELEGTVATPRPRPRRADAVSSPRRSTSSNARSPTSSPARARPARHPRLRGAHRREDRRRDRRRRPVQVQRRLRPPQRHRPAARLVVEQGPPPALPHREPATQRRPAPHRHHPGPLPPRRQRPDGPTQSRRRHRPRSPPRSSNADSPTSSTPPYPRRLEPPSAGRCERRRRSGRPG